MGEARYALSPSGRSALQMYSRGIATTGTQWDGVSFRRCLLDTILDLGPSPHLAVPPNDIFSDAVVLLRCPDSSFDSELAASPAS
jgi:hypothetical protein